MNLADKYYKENLLKLAYKSSLDEKPRAKYRDGTPAHTKFITQVFEKYDISKNEFPIPTIRKTAIKTGIKEILTIFQTQLNTKESFESNGVFWWEPWFNENGDIGRSYPYNLESHRPNEMRKSVVKIKPRIIDKKYSVLSQDYSATRSKYGVGYLGNYTDVKNISDKHLNILMDKWEEMFQKCYSKEFVYKEDFVHQDWHSFESFLNDIRFIPQYHLAKEQDFEGWILDKNYYGSNCYSKESCTFLTIEEYNELDVSNDDYLYRKELSRNQLNDLLEGLKNNPYGRRHIMSFWNWSNIDKKELVECAFETLWSVRKVGNELTIDMTLIQRSNDYFVAGYINKIQYVALMMMVCGHLGYKFGNFSHLTNNLHYYDRHENALQELLNTKPIDVQPILLLKTKRKFYNYTVDDFEIVNTPKINKLKSTLELAI